MSRTRTGQAIWIPQEIYEALATRAEPSGGHITATAVGILASDLGVVVPSRRTSKLPYDALRVSATLRQLLANGTVTIEDVLRAQAETPPPQRRRQNGRQPS